VNSPRLAALTASILAGLVGVLAACASKPQDRAYEPAPSLVPLDAAPPPDFSSRDAEVEADAAFETCASVAMEATRSPLPVDIIWVVDNSPSMQPAVAEVQAGLNSFATIVGSRGLDYKVVMLSLRGTAPVTIGGKARYPVCIPPPLGAADCGNTPLFFHAPMDVQSTQPLEQILGSLDQTTGYTAGAARGSEPWSQELRPNATKSFVLVTDDNSRFPGVSFEGFPGGDNPNTGGLVLPPGLLHPSRKGAFTGYSFSALYGWGSTADPSIRCTYPDNTKPPASGSEYTALIQKTGGARAQICAGSAAWGTFFDDVATAVVATSRVACDLPIPAADAGTLDPSLVNVRVTDGAKPPLTVPRVTDEAACVGLDGWYYDVPAAPARVLLCPRSCEGAQSKGVGAKLPKVEVLFGCQTVVR
jgi:hypothetical protein